jgi:hypothetical protein
VVLFIERLRRSKSKEAISLVVAWITIGFAQPGPPNQALPIELATSEAKQPNEVLIHRAEDAKFRVRVVRTKFRARVVRTGV